MSDHTTMSMAFHQAVNSPMKNVPEDLSVVAGDRNLEEVERICKDGQEPREAARSQDEFKASSSRWSKKKDRLPEGRGEGQSEPPLYVDESGNGVEFENLPEEFEDEVEQDILGYNRAYSWERVTISTVLAVLVMTLIVLIGILVFSWQDLTRAVGM